MNKTELEDDIIYLSTRGKSERTISSVPFSHLVAGFQAALRDENLTLDNLYDCLVTSGIGSKVISHIPAEEYDFIRGSIVAQLDEYYDYKNSALGIMESIVKDYSNVNLDAGEVQKKLADPQNLALLKDIMKKLG